MQQPTRVIIDTDPGLDDTAAILFTLACPERVTVEMFTTVFGNTAIEHVTRNMLSILDVAGRNDIPVYQGAVRPLLREPNFAHHIHSQDGLGGLAAQYLPSGAVQPGIAAEKIVEHIMASPGEVTLIALGPLTNVALALLLEPKLASSVYQMAAFTKSMTGMASMRVSEGFSGNAAAKTLPKKRADLGLVMLVMKPRRQAANAERGSAFISPATEPVRQSCTAI